MASPPNPQLVTAMQQAAATAGRGQWPQAEYHYRQAIMLAPADPILAIGLGHVLRQMQRPAEAKAQFAIAARLAPASADACYGMGLACQDMMDMAGAEDAYRGALARNSGMLPAALGLATICNYTNRPDEALALLANASSPDPRAGAAIEQACGTAQLMKEQYEAALARFERVLALEPAHAEAAHSRAVAQQYLGREEEALTGLRQVVKDNPANLMAHHNLNQLLYRLRRDDEFL